MNKEINHLNKDNTKDIIPMFHISKCHNAFTIFIKENNTIAVLCTFCNQKCYTITDNIQLFSLFTDDQNSDNISSNKYNYYKDLLKRSSYDKTLPNDTEICTNCNVRKKYMLINRIEKINICPKCLY